MEVEPGLELLQLADLSAVWVDARFYEYEAQHVAPGATVTVRPAHEPGLSLSGTIDYVYPVLDEATRTLRARIVLDNGFGNLRPGMYADVLLEVDLGEGLAIPDDAILDTGRRQVVFVAEGGGRFVPREVAVGDRSEGLARIVDGIEPGDQVVVKAAFLLDSESRIRAALLPAPGTPAEGGHAGGHVDGTPR
jgi:RND family efflux transporter MFP subunit